MSHRIGNMIIIEATPPGQCDLCGAIAELRPYGPNGENICFACGEKNKVATEHQCLSRLLGMSKKEIILATTDNN